MRLKQRLFSNTTVMESGARSGTFNLILRINRNGMRQNSNKDQGEVKIALEKFDLEIMRLIFKLGGIW